MISPETLSGGNVPDYNQSALVLAVDVAQELVPEIIAPHIEVRYDGKPEGLAIIVAHGSDISHRLNPLGAEASAVEMPKAATLFSRNLYKRDEPITPAGLGLPPQDAVNDDGLLPEVSSAHPRPSVYNVLDSKYWAARETLRKSTELGVDRYTVNAFAKAYMVMLKLEDALANSERVPDIVTSINPELQRARESFFGSIDLTSSHLLTDPNIMYLGAMASAGGVFDKRSGLEIAVSGREQNDDLTIAGATHEGYLAGANGGSTQDIHSAIEAELIYGVEMKRVLAKAKTGSSRLGDLTLKQVAEVNTGYYELSARNSGRPAPYIV